MILLSLSVSPFKPKPVSCNARSQLGCYTCTRCQSYKSVTPAPDEKTQDGNGTSIIFTPSAITTYSAVATLPAATKNSEIFSTIDMKSFLGGTYIVRLTKEDGAVLVHKIMKQ